MAAIKTTKPPRNSNSDRCSMKFISSFQVNKGCSTHTKAFPLYVVP